MGKSGRGGGGEAVQSRGVSQPGGQRQIRTKECWENKAARVCFDRLIDVSASGLGFETTSATQRNFAWRER